MKKYFTGAVLASVMALFCTVAVAAPGDPPCCKQAPATSQANATGPIVTMRVGNPSTVIVDAKSADGQTVGVKAGNNLDLTFSENISTGYSWALKSSSSQGAQMTMTAKTRHALPGPAMPGKPEEAVFHFQTAGKGTMTLEFVYTRPWDPTPAQTVTVTIDVK